MLQTRHRRAAVSLALSLTLVASCASLQPKERAALTLNAVQTTASQVQDLEISLFNAQTQGLTAERHVAFHRGLVRLFDAVERTAIALRAWRAGDPAPASLAEALVAAQETLAVLAQVGGPPLERALAYAKSLVDSLIAIDQLLGGNR